MGKKYTEWENEYPEHVIVRKENFFYTARNESAKVIHNILGYKLLRDKKNNIKVGGPKKNTIVEGLASNKINYIIIENSKIVQKEEFEGSCFYYKTSKNITYNEESYIKKTEEFKDEKELINFIDIILNGVDPLTGEKIRKDNIIFNKKMEEILFITKKAINSRIGKK